MEYIKSCTCLSFEPYKSHFTITVEEMISSFLLRSGGASCKPFFFFYFLCLLGKVQDLDQVGMPVDWPDFMLPFYVGWVGSSGVNFDTLA